MVHPGKGFPSSAGMRSIPSMGRSEGRLAPANFAVVGKKSTKDPTSLETCPADTRPGQRATQGTRIPPSHMSPLAPLKRHSSRNCCPSSILGHLSEADPQRLTGDAMTCGPRLPWAPLCRPFRPGSRYFRSIRHFCLHPEKAIEEEIGGAVSYDI